MGDPRAEFAAAVGRLRARVPDLTDEALARRAGAVVLPSGRRVAVDARRLGEWVAGRSVPRDFDAVLAVVLATGGSGQVARLRELWRVARERRGEVERAGVERAAVERAAVGRGELGRGGFERCVVGRPPGEAAAVRSRSVPASAIDAALGEDGVRQVVVTGAGGVGKSQLAVAAFHRARCEVRVWVSAASRRSVVAGYARAWRALGEAHGSDDDLQADLFLAWLRSARAPWLVVLDGVDDPAELAGLWPAGEGRCLVTTRRRDATLLRPGSRVVPVAVFTPEEATGYLAERLSVDPRHSVAELSALAEALGHHPLALAQAAAFLIDTGLDVPAYLDRLADRRHAATDLFPPCSPADEHGGTVAEVVARSVELARALSPDAPALLAAAALLPSDGIPQEVLLHGRDLLALRALHRVHLVTHRDGRVDTHPLVQRAAGDLVQVPAIEVADALEHVWTDAGPGLAAALSRCTEVLVEIAGEQLWTGGLHPVVRRLLRHLSASGRPIAALSLAERLLPNASAPQDIAYLHTRIAWAVGDLAAA